MLNVSAPGNFEEGMPGIAQWFVERPPAHSRVRSACGVQTRWNGSALALFVNSCASQ